MAQGRRKVPEASENPKLSAIDILVLIFRTYAASLPYILIFVAVMLVATWLVTEVVFR